MTPRPPASFRFAQPAGQDGPHRAMRQLRTEIRREIAFEAALRRKVNNGYKSYARTGKAPVDIEQFLDDVRKLSKRTLGKDVVGKPRIFQVPFVGRLVDSFGKGLGQHLTRYNKHLVLGQRNGRPVEGLMLTRLSLRVVDPVEGMESLRATFVERLFLGLTSNDVVRLSDGTDLLVRCLASDVTRDLDRGAPVTVIWKRGDARLHTH